MKKIFYLLLILSTITFANNPPAEKARGIFVAFGVGPRLPVSYFANSTELGYGFNLEISYTDNEYLPVFLFAKVGFEQYPGSNSYYQATDHSNLATSILPAHAGIRYYFAPLMENIVLLIPIVEVSAAFTYYEILHEFKVGTGKSNFIEENSKLGISFGAGISMFMMEILAAYNYFETSQYIALDLKVRLPLFINF